MIAVRRVVVALALASAVAASAASCGDGEQTSGKGGVAGGAGAAKRDGVAVAAKDGGAARDGAVGGATSRDSGSAVSGAGALADGAPSDGAVASDAAPADAGAADAAAAAAGRAGAGSSAERVERVVWRAIDNRAMAHRSVGDDVAIDAGDHGFARFVRYGIPVMRWKLAQLIDGEPGALAAPLAALELPLTAEQARATILTVRLHSAETAFVSLKVNGRAPRRKPIELRPGWQNVAQELPPGWLLPGNNQIVLEHGKSARRLGKSKGKPSEEGVALAWVRAGRSRDFTTPLPAARFFAGTDSGSGSGSGSDSGTGSDSGSGSGSGSGSASGSDSGSGSGSGSGSDSGTASASVSSSGAASASTPGPRRIELHTGAAVAWYVTLPEGGHLRASVAPPCRVSVRATTSDGSFVGGRLGSSSEARSVVRGGTRSDEAVDRVDLSSFAGRVVRLELRAELPDPDPGAAPSPAARCEVARIEEPVITVHGPEVAPPSPGKPPRYVILWVLDATRADRIPIFTPGAAVQTPNLEELARSSAVFRQYYVQGNESQTSHSSVWTGVYPAVHNVRLAGVGGTSRISKKLPVLGELVKGAGLFPIGVTGNGFVNDSGGYDRGFEEFRNMMREKGVINGVLYGDKIVAAALGRLEAHRDEPAFLFFGTVDSHSPWIARKPWIDRYSPDPYEGPFKVHGDGFALGFQKGKMGCSKLPPPKDVARLRAIYDSTISYSDDLIGKLISQLKIWNMWDETMLIITADHGDELFEHGGRCGHGGTLRDTLVRVPLLVHYPAQFPAAFLDEGAEAVDIVPTILDALGAAPLASAQGHSLRGLVNGVGRGWTWPSYASQYEYAHAMRMGRWKIAVNIRGEVSVFDMREDPYEAEERSALHPVEARMLADHLGLFLANRARWQKASWGVVSSISAQGAKALDGPVR